MAVSCSLLFSGYSELSEIPLKRMQLTAWAESTVQRVTAKSMLIVLRISSIC